jgi:F-type H+-transporting ATPase subunit epsilon
VPFQVEVVSPERILYSGEAEMVICRTVDGGDIAFLAEHAPFLGALEIGVVQLRTEGGNDRVAAVHGGFVEVRDNRVIILSDVAELPDQIDRGRAEKAKQDAERMLSEAGGDEEAEAEARAALRRAEVRLEVAEKG